MRLTLFGIVVAVLGGIALYFGGVPYTQRDQVVDVGPLQASTETQRRLDIPPLLSGGILAFGVGIAAYGAVKDD